MEKLSTPHYALSLSLSLSHPIDVFFTTGILPTYQEEQRLLPHFMKEQRDIAKVDPFLIDAFAFGVFRRSSKDDRIILDRQC